MVENKSVWGKLFGLPTSEIKLDEVLVKQACLHRIMQDIPHDQPDVMARHIKHCLELYKKVVAESHEKN